MRRQASANSERVLVSLSAIVAVNHDEIRVDRGEGRAPATLYPAVLGDLDVLRQPRRAVEDVVPEIGVAA